MIDAQTVRSVGVAVIDAASYYPVLRIQRLLK
jgi:hypothetical protein